MTRIPRTRRRSLAVVGMLCVLPLAAWLYLVAGLTIDGVFENVRPDDVAQAERFVVLATIAAVAALTSLVGLAIRRRGVAVVGSFAVSGSALAFLVDSEATGWWHGWLPAVLVVAAVAVGLVGLWAALTPAPLEHAERVSRGTTRARA